MAEYARTAVRSTATPTGSRVSPEEKQEAKIQTSGLTVPRRWTRPGIHPFDEIAWELQTASIHGSGITDGNGALWITSTKMTDPAMPPRTLKVDPKTGKTLASWVTPGSGLYGNITPRSTPSGGHGLKWVDGKYWMAVPASGKLFLMEPETGDVVRSIPAPGVRTHGLAWDDGVLWCVESDGRAIYKLDPRDGRPVAKIQLARADPEPHGLDISQGVLWYCDAASGWICRLV